MGSSCIGQDSVPKDKQWEEAAGASRLQGDEIRGQMKMLFLVLTLTFQSMAKSISTEMPFFPAS